MNQKLHEKCDLLVSTAKEISSVLERDTDGMCLAAACVYLWKNKTVDGKKLRECVDFAEKDAAAPAYRNSMGIPLVCRMALSDAYEPYFDNVRRVVRRLGRNLPSGSDNLLIAAMTLCDQPMEEADFQRSLRKTNDLYLMMKRAHRFITSTEDIPFAAMLAVSGQDINPLMNDMESVFANLHRQFRSEEAVQSLSHVLALYSQNAEQKCERLRKLYERLKEAHIPFGKYRDLSMLGLLLMLECPDEELVTQIQDAEAYLRTQEGIVLSENARYVYAAQMVIDTLCSDAMRKNKAMDSNAVVLAVGWDYYVTEMMMKE